MTGYLGIKGDSTAINFISSTTTNKQKWLYPGTFSTTNAIVNYMPSNSGTLISDYSLNVDGLRLGWDYLISTNATTTGTNYTIQNSRKFSDYGYILFLCNDGGLVRNPSIIPRALFDGSSDGYKYNVEIDYSNLQTLRWVSIRHTSDTQALIAAYANSAVSVHIFGVKIKLN